MVNGNPCPPITAVMEPQAGFGTLTLQQKAPPVGGAYIQE